MLGFIAGTILAQRLVGRRGMDGVIGIGVACLAGGGIAHAGLRRDGLRRPARRHRADGALCLRRRADHAAGAGLGDDAVSRRAGAASSFNGLCQMLLSACVGLLVGRCCGASALPMPLVMSGLGVAAFAIFHASAGVRAAKA